MTASRRRKFPPSSYIEETDTEPARYEALLLESGLLVLALQ